MIDWFPPWVGIAARVGVVVGGVFFVGPREVLHDQIVSSGADGANR